MTQAFRDIPPVDRLVARFEARFAPETRPLVVRAVRELVEDFRGRIEKGHRVDAAQYFEEEFSRRLEERVAAWSAPRHRSVINATGVLLHTGLGRAPLADAAVQALEQVARYSVVEVDPDTGLRGRREQFVRDLLVELTGAEDATVVNNNAAAVLLLLRALARGREVVVSRGQLVEIGGGFRVPAVMEESGAQLVEVGTTNRTRLTDYEKAVSGHTALLLWVHPSNFRIVGFTESVALEELVALGRRCRVPVGADLGSGYLRRFPELPFPDEPTVAEALSAGADVVTFSGDKMLGGPQAGILLGKRELILELRGQPLFRAVRPDKLTLAALEATLRIWRNAGTGAPRGLPFLDALRQTRATLEERGRRILADLGSAVPGLELVDSEAQVGSGSVPGRSVPSLALRLEAPGGLADRVAARLRCGTPPVFVRVKEGQVFLDLRSVLPAEDRSLAEALKRGAADAFKG